ncbi:hypothetical protein Ancab_035035 [Ancistrocladus abbreviatus]
MGNRENELKELQSLVFKLAKEIDWKNHVLMEMKEKSVERSAAMAEKDRLLKEQMSKTQQMKIQNEKLRHELEAQKKELELRTVELEECKARLRRGSLFENARMKIEYISLTPQQRKPQALDCLFTQDYALWLWFVPRFPVSLTALILVEEEQCATLLCQMDSMEQSYILSCHLILSLSKVIDGTKEHNSPNIAPWYSRTIAVPTFSSQIGLAAIFEMGLSLHASFY